MKFTASGRRGSRETVAVSEAAALDAAGAALGALGLVAFAIAFFLLVENGVLAAFISASLAWLIVSMTAWWVRRKLPSVHRRRSGKRTSGSASRGATAADATTGVRPRS